MSAPTARLNPRHQEMIREKIRSDHIVKRLEDHVFGEVEMTKSQVSAALGLLKKCVPDLTSTAITDPDGGPISLSVGFLAASQRPAS